MIVNQFQTWIRTASTAKRADGASALARAYLYSDLSNEQRRDAERTLTGFLDDPSPLVRRALAEAFASAKDAPHHIVLALADDQSAIASILLARSPVLSDAELIDCSAGADGVAQSAVASRPSLSASVAAALAEIGHPETLVVLAGNRGAPIPAFSFHRMIERCGDQAALREAMLSRSDLPPSARIDLVLATTRALSAFVTSRAWMTQRRMDRVAIEARDRAVVAISTEEASRTNKGPKELIAYLRTAGHLTVGLAFRAILSGRTELFKAILSELSGSPLARIDALVRTMSSTGFAAVYRKAGLPEDLLPAFVIALKTAQAEDWHATSGRPACGGLSRRAVEHVITGCETINSGELDKLVVLLRRFESEAAREEVRVEEAFATPLRLTDTHDVALMLDDCAESAPTRSTLLEREETQRSGRPILKIDFEALESELCAA